MKASEMQIGVWYETTPEFDMECVFATVTLFRDSCEYSIWEIKKLDGEDDNGNHIWYYGLLTGDGIEWGDIGDFSSDKFLIIPPHNNLKSSNVI